MLVCVNSFRSNNTPTKPPAKEWRVPAFFLAYNYLTKQFHKEPDNRKNTRVISFTILKI